MATPSKKQLAAGQRRSLAAIRKKLLDMAAQWDEVDQFCMNELEALADKAQEAANNLTDSE